MIKQKDDKISKAKIIPKNVRATKDMRAEAQARDKNLAWIVVFCLLANILEKVYI